MPVQRGDRPAELGEQSELQPQHLETELAGDVVGEQMGGLRRQERDEAGERVRPAGLGGDAAGDRLQLGAARQLHRPRPSAGARTAARWRATRRT